MNQTVVDVKNTEVALGETLERHLCFSMNNEEYAIPLLSVVEVLAVPEVTPVPSNPPYILGIINIRGQIVSIMDLRVKLGIKPSKSDEEAVIICNVGGNTIGVVVDSVNAVFMPLVEYVSPRPALRNSQYAHYIKNLYHADNKMVLFIEFNDIFGAKK